MWIKSKQLDVKEAMQDKRKRQILSRTDYLPVMGLGMFSLRQWLAAVASPSRRCSVATVAEARIDCGDTVACKG